MLGRRLWGPVGGEEGNGRGGLAGRRHAHGPGQGWARSAVATARPSWGEARGSWGDPIGRVGGGFVPALQVTRNWYSCDGRAQAQPRTDRETVNVYIGRVEGWGAMGEWGDPLGARTGFLLLMCM